MEYQKIANLLDDASNKISKFRTKSWVKINNESKGTYDVGSEIKFNPAYVIIVVHISMLGELLLLIILLLHMLM